MLIAYIVGRFTPNFHRLLNTITTTAPGYLSHRTEAPSGRSNVEPISSLDIFHGCGMEGDARSLGVRALDRLKNRYTEPRPADMDSAITLKAILAPGNDISRWKVKEGAEIIGYVSDVKRGGVEATNCHARDDADRDTHIELVLDPMRSSSLPMIVEVTPRWRYLMNQHGIDWSTRALRDRFLGRWVRFEAGCCLTPSTSRNPKTQRQGGQATGEQRPGRFIPSHGLRLWLDNSE